MKWLVSLSALDGLDYVELSEHCVEQSDEELEPQGEDEQQDGADLGHEAFPHDALAEFDSPMSSSRPSSSST